MSSTHEHPTVVGTHDSSMERTAALQHYSTTQPSGIVSHYQRSLTYSSLESTHPLPADW